MPTIYLGVNQSFSASGITAQGSIDSTSGSTLGTILPCPGVFPCTIRAKSTVKGSSTAVVEAVYSGPNHIVLKETLHDYIPASGARIRIENKGIGVKVVGGTYIESLNFTLTPVLKPYTYEPYRSISLNGLPAELFAGTPPTGAVTLNGNPNNPDDPLNVFSNFNGFQYTFAEGQLSEACNILWTGGTTGNPPLAINVSGLWTNDRAQYVLDSGDTLLPYYTPVNIKYPLFTAGESPELWIIDYDPGGESYYDPEANNRSASNLIAVNNAPDFNCFDSTTKRLKASTFGTQSHPNFIKSLCALRTEESSYAGFSYLGIKSNLSLFLGAFANIGVPIDSDWPIKFFQFYDYAAGGTSPKNIAPTKPSIGINTNIVSVYANIGIPQTLNALWEKSSPTGLRHSRYSDIKATQYGYVLLNEDTKHLEFMFTAHVDPWMESAEAQVINKLMRAPPRSADHLPALNMMLGCDPRTGTAGESLYKVNDVTIRGWLDTDQIIHGGGGHVIALGTYNGAIVNNGKVTVWGSNRWGQLVLPEPMRSTSFTITDVAVSNAPPVLTNSNDSNFYYTVYSEEAAEKAARSFIYGLSGNENNVFKFSYPESFDYRYGGHINYENLPGHVVVVTSTGRVYAWGNNKYYQCEVPDDISLVDSAGNINTTQLLDPIIEVSAGAYHTVARSKTGVIYVWGAGGPWASQNDTAIIDGRVSISNHNVRPNTGTLAFNATNTTVHFGQSMLKLGSASETTQGYVGLATPSAAPIGLSSYASDTHATSLTPNYTAVFTITKSIKGTPVDIGQKTNAGFAPVVTDDAGGENSSRRMKGMIAAGAFHTAIIDNQLKIQCVGAGRGPTTQQMAHPNSSYSFNNSTIPQWGSSYTDGDGGESRFSTYPHYCQSLSQYRIPAPNADNTTTSAGLFRYSAFGQNNQIQSKSKYFQDLLFKKVICGPFSTHGIIYSASKIPPSGGTEVFTAKDKVWLHGRVVSWGCAFSFRSFQTNGTSSTGILGPRYTANDNTDPATYNAQPSNNPAGTLSGLGSVLRIGNSAGNDVDRMFEIINRVPNSTGQPGIYPLAPGAGNNHLVLVGVPSPNSEAVSNPSVGVVSNNANESQPAYNTDCPVTISRFKVKDVAVCGEFATYIGFYDKFTRSSLKLGASDNDLVSSGATFDYQASVFFTGNDPYRDSNIFSIAESAYRGRFNAINPYVGNNVARRNRKRNETGIYYWLGDTGLPMKTRSFHFGPVKYTDTGTGTPLGVTNSISLKYVLPTTALASANLAVVIVNMDNRPVSWLGYIYSPTYRAPLDLSLLPSIPIQSFKTGKAHILAVSAGDWPVATSLRERKAVPKLASELSTRLFQSVTGNGIATKLIADESNFRYYRPVLLAWGAGDGREFGSTLLSLASPSNASASGIFGPGSGVDSVFGLGFLDTHAVSRYDATYTTGTVQGLAVNADAWENYYGHYRWNVNSRSDGLYDRPELPGISLGSASGSAYSAMFGPPGHHAVEALQSLLGFQHHLYPSTFTNPALGARGLLNGANKSAIPAAAFMPFITSSSQTGNKARCCITAAEESPSFESLNSLQEYHSPLGYTQQTYTDFVVDYAAGSMHSAVLFRSSCASWTQINSNAHLANMNAFSTHFMTDVNGSISFGQRKVCKLGIVGYGCEGQTAGSARILQDGSVAPLVPRLFGTDAKVYCGDSYTLVTNPIRIVEASSGSVALTGFNSGSGFTSKTIPISIPSSAYSKRIRGLDVKIQVVASTGTVNLPMSSWDITIPYKQNEWVVFKRLKANLDTTPADAFIQASTIAATFRISDRFSAASAYAYNGTYEAYTERGLDPNNSSSYTGTSPYFLKPISTSAAVPALDKSGCYYPVDVNPSTFAVTNQTWSVNGTTPAATVLPFNEPTINVIIKDYTSTLNYADCSINITLEIEVDAEELPYILYGPDKAGVWNELPGVSPSFGADISSFNPNDDVSSGSSTKSRWIRNCPCEIDNQLYRRKYPVGYPADARFICGTKKYGPSGNRETAAADALNSTFNYSNFSEEAQQLKHKITANFFSVFDTIPHRPFLDINNQIAALNPSLQVLPRTAFINQEINLGTPPNINTRSSIIGVNISINRVLRTPSHSIVLNVVSAALTKPTLQTSVVICSANVRMTINSNLGRISGLNSTNCQ